MSEWELVAEHSRLVSEPPDGLLACIVVPEGDGEMRAITVWETPGHRGEFAASVMMPLFDSGVLAGLQNNPEPVRPVALFVRGQDSPCHRPSPFKCGSWTLRERPRPGDR